MKRIIMILVFALVGAVAYWLRAEYNITTSRYASVNDAKDIDFSWGYCLLWAAVGGLIGALPIKSKKQRERN